MSFFVKNLILHEDVNLLVLNKPAGVPVLPDGWEPEALYLVRLLSEQYGKVWVVHRLDKVTSGVIVFARNAAAHRTLSLLFETHEVHKTYHAIVVGLPPWDDHTARHPLRVNVGHSHRTAVDHGKGKPSETVFNVLERFSAASLLEVRPLTGRTHQVRVHAYALGFPLLGDTLYSAPPTDLIARPALHASTLEFEYDKHPFSFSAPYPDDFQNAIQELRAGH